MKKKIFKVVLPLISNFLNVLFFVWHKFLTLKNINKPAILLYTDSRGFNVINRWGKIFFDSYLNGLINNYRVTYFICPEKYTTIIDFLDTVKNHDTSKYKAVILHCGVVDFSPRPISNIAAVKDSKKNDHYFSDVFKANEHYYSKPFSTLYKGEPTVNLYSKEYLLNKVMPQLAEIKNLVWINSNRFAKNWEGNFTKGRPENIGELVGDFDSILNKYLRCIDLKEWSDTEIKKYTIDNIHFTQIGFDEICNRTVNQIKKIDVKEVN
ncbi:hypothetical protein EPL05_21270 [Mucilaginibacter gilvus]|uniref:SGNH/GDSL hydrolase family protein n=1 Tax=Mucilaginibacter gilvus TaxID=2305909 RepID=A0A3S3UJW4_9SPHI|nr:hypothetical protein EPL05_21270 [Mucilaginibacter gilvus]